MTLMMCSKSKGPILTIDSLAMEGDMTSIGISSLSFSQKMFESQKINPENPEQQETLQPSGIKCTMSNENTKMIRARTN